MDRDCETGSDQGGTSGCEYGGAEMTTDEEKAVAMKFAEAWTAYLSLKDRDSNADAEMNAAVHRCQDVIRGRIARRVDPEFWP